MTAANEEHSHRGFAVVHLEVKGAPFTPAEDGSCCGQTLLGSVEEYFPSPNVSCVRTNGIPLFDYRGDSDMKQMQPCERNSEVCLGEYKEHKEAKSFNTLDPIGYMLSGGFIYSHEDIHAVIDSAKNNPNPCGGFVDDQGGYHYSRLDCLDAEGSSEGRKSKLLGYMFDGIAVYSHVVCYHNNDIYQSRPCRSCYKEQEDGSFQYKPGLDCDLDEANGMCLDGDVNAYFDGSYTCRSSSYVYIATENFPFAWPKHWGYLNALTASTELESQGMNCASQKDGREPGRDYPEILFMVGSPGAHMLYPAMSKPNPNQTMYW